MEHDAHELTEQWASIAEGIEHIAVAPRKSDIYVQMVALALAPAWEVTYEDARGHSRTDSIPAYRTQSA